MKKYIIIAIMGVTLFAIVKGSPLYCRSSERLSDYDTLFSEGPKSKSTTSKSYAHFLMGKMLDNDLKFEQALDEYKKALQQDPNSPTINTSIALDYIRLNKPDEATAHLNVALENDPTDLRARFTLALLYTITKKFDKAAEQYEDIVKRNPHNIKALASLADLYVVQQKIEEATKIYEDILREGKD